MKVQRFHTVHFENLIGSKGGGSDDVQAQEILKMAEHLRIELSPEKLAHVQKELFGNSRTFRQGKTGGWQQTFTPEMKSAFKNVPGANQLLIDLGYEKDSNW